MTDKVAIAREYLKARMAEDNATVLSLVSDDVSMSTPKDGSHKGKQAFEQYLKTVKPAGKWEEPVLDGDSVTVKGTVPVRIMSVSVLLRLEFNGDGKIHKIELKKQ